MLTSGWPWSSPKPGLTACHWYHGAGPDTLLVHAGPEPTPAEVALAGPAVDRHTLLIVKGPEFIEPPARQPGEG